MAKKNKYKVGDKFPATVTISSVDPNTNYPYMLIVDELDTYLDDCFSREDLDAAFDPTYKERKRLERIEELKKELAELEGKDE